MIKNERQYKISQRAYLEFEKALSRFDEKAYNEYKVDARLAGIEKKALLAQAEDLKEDLVEYELLKSGKVNKFRLRSLGEIPATLIKARIASGLTHRELADKLEMKEQQIQRYEASDYKGISIDRVIELCNALGISIELELELSKPAYDLAAVKKNVASVGVDEDLFEKVVVDLSAYREREIYQEIPMTSFSGYGRVFGWTPEEMESGEGLEYESEFLEAANFKTRKGIDVEKNYPYVKYLNYLAKIVSSGIKESRKDLVEEPVELYESLMNQYGEFNLCNLTSYLWDVGFAVLPLARSGSFHGAHFCIDKKHVIMVKQTTLHHSRWMFDMLHEYWHATDSNISEETKFTIDLYDSFVNDRNDEDEYSANMFSGDCILKGEAEDLLQKAIAISDGRVEYLKSSIQKIAKGNNVPIDALANYAAFRLSMDGINWWGAASNLQINSPDPRLVVKDIFVDRFDFSHLDEIDYQLLKNALA